MGKRKVGKKGFQNRFARGLHSVVKATIRPNQPKKKRKRKK